MSQRNTRFLYTAYVVLTVGIFVYLLFPADNVKAYLTARLSQVAPDVEVTIRSIKPSLLLGLKLSEVAVFVRNEPVADFESLIVRPGISSLWRQFLVLNFDVDAYDGEIEGRVQVDREQPGGVIAEVTLSGLQLSDITALKNWIPHNVRGGLTGSFSWQQDGTGRNGKLNLRLTDSGVEFVHPVYGTDQIRFSAIDTGLELKNNQIKIERFTAKGPDVEGSITGSIMVRTPPDRSILNISGEMTPQAVFMDNLRKSMPIDALLKNKEGAGIPFRIGGTPRDPKFSLR